MLTGYIGKVVSDVEKTPDTVHIKFTDGTELKVEAAASDQFAFPYVIINDEDEEIE